MARALALSLLLLAPLGLGAIPAASSEAASVHARNAAFLRAFLDDADLSQPATLHDGRVLPLAQAIDEAALRAGGVDLGRLVALAGQDDDPHVGDMWYLEFGMGGCPLLVGGFPVPGLSPDPQLHIYGGSAGLVQSDGPGQGVLIDWTTKETVVGGANGMSAAGTFSDFCFSFAGQYFWFPLISGVVRWN